MLSTLLASSILSASRLSVELMRANPANPRIFSFVSGKKKTTKNYFEPLVTTILRKFRKLEKIRVLFFLQWIDRTAG